LHPNVVEKLRQEHNRVFDADIAKTEQMLQEFPQKTNELEYTKAVIKEALRMFPLGFPARAAKPG
jgi:cytochrome P450